MTSSVRVIQVCEALAAQQPIGVRELARVIGAPPSTVQRALETLEVAGWAVRTDSGVWCISTRPILVAARAGSAGALRELAGPALARMQSATDESVRLWIRDGHRVAIVVSVESARAVRFVSPPTGTTLPLHASAAGKAILAALPEYEIEAFLSGGLDALTPQTVVNADALRDQIAEIRVRGYAITRNEAYDDVGGVAAVVVDSAHRPAGAFSISLPMHRLTDDLIRTYGALVVAEAAALSHTLHGVPT